MRCHCYANVYFKAPLRCRLLCKSSLFVSVAKRPPNNRGKSNVCEIVSVNGYTLKSFGQERQTVNPLKYRNAFAVVILLQSLLSASKALVPSNARY